MVSNCLANPNEAAMNSTHNLPLSWQQEIKNILDKTDYTYEEKINTANQKTITLTYKCKNANVSKDGVSEKLSDFIRKYCGGHSACQTENGQRRLVLHPALFSENFSLDDIIPNPKDNIENFISDMAEDSSKYLTRWNYDNSAYSFPSAYYSQLYLKGELYTHLSEESHPFHPGDSRFQTGNSRTLIENEILKYVELRDKNIPINILSIDPQKYLQDLVIVCKLLHAGFKNINITCIDLDKKNRNDLAGKEFEKIAQDINLHFKSKIKCAFYKSIDDIPDENRAFDIIQAINIERLHDWLDYSGNKAIEDDFYKGKFTSQYKDDKCSYEVVMTFIKGISFLKDEQNILVALSNSINRKVYTLTKQGDNIAFEDNLMLPALICPNNLQRYCINASLEMLIRYLPLFVQEKKPLCINNKIFRPEDKPYVEAMLDKFNLKYTFYEENEFELIRADKLTLVINTTKSEINDPILSQLSALTDHGNDMDNKVLNILQQPCLIQRATNLFFSENITLHKYLQNLSAASNLAAREKAQAIIYHLNNRDWNKLKEALSITRNWLDPLTETTGLKIYRALEEAGFLSADDNSNIINHNFI